MAFFHEERKVHVAELGEIEDCDGGSFKAWDSQTKAVATVGITRYPKKAKCDVDRMEKTFLRHSWQSVKELFAVGDRSSGESIPSPQGRVVNGLPV